ncbi:probable serine/threonine-protein kinase DDB_G0271682 [Orbicella faveolata]|uniref:probable serine/threonine-protein kinase DDB_G0271682 n=1 Tax=Orbicella faveolata TaxID=48498 RepID=UPI0009E60365|nr:probable serine/threonine-protein kinase DDB_G0271682 [Orbicella faveolata]
MENELEQIRQRLDNEISLRNTTEQEPREKETIINEQRTTAETQGQTFEEELNLRTGQIESKETALRDLRRLLVEERQQKTDLEERLRNLQLEMEEERDRRASTERELNTATERQTHQTRDWIIQRKEVVLSGKVLGKGAWGEVLEGSFRSCQVAVKKIHDMILSDHNRKLFEREMTIASCCRHPNLLQFIGATNDDGHLLFVTELLEISLRRLLSQRALNDEEIVSLSMNVAKGLNYLHLNRPHPIIHRDISSANVLLWRRDEC